MAAASDKTETYLVAPRTHGPDGLAALMALADRVRAIPGGLVEQPAPVPGLTRPTPRLVVTLPAGRGPALAAEFGHVLVFDANAELGY